MSFNIQLNYHFCEFFADFLVRINLPSPELSHKLHVSLCNPIYNTSG